MRKDIVQGPAQKLDEVTKASPEFVQMAQDRLRQWDTKEYLLSVFARALEEAHAMGAAGKRPRRARAEEQTIEEELATSKPSPPRAKRVGRTPPEPTTTRVRRTR